MPRAGGDAAGLPRAGTHGGFLRLRRRKHALARWEWRGARGAHAVRRRGGRRRLLGGGERRDVAAGRAAGHAAAADDERGARRVLAATARADGCGGGEGGAAALSRVRRALHAGGGAGAATASSAAALAAPFAPAPLRAAAAGRGGQRRALVHGVCRSGFGSFTGGDRSRTGRRCSRRCQHSVASRRCRRHESRVRCQLLADHAAAAVRRCGGLTHTRRQHVWRRHRPAAADAACGGARGADTAHARSRRRCLRVRVPTAAALPLLSAPPPVSRRPLPLPLRSPPLPPPCPTPFAA